MAVRNVKGTIVCCNCGAIEPWAGPQHRFCRPCAVARKLEMDRGYAAANREGACAKAKAWRAANLERAQAASRAYYEANRDLIRLQQAEKHRKHGEKARQRATRYYAKNRERILERMKSEDGRRRAREYMRAKMVDPAARLHTAVSRHIRASLHDKHRRSWETIVGYSLDELCRHLERQFLKGMTWANYGRGEARWHVDHIVPRHAFSFSSADDPEFLACWALTNLRPLWAGENISKHAKRFHLL